MPYALRKVACTDCGAVVEGRFPKWKKQRCLDCAIVNMEIAALEMAKRSGTYYDRWLASAGPRGRPPKSSP
jgi:hypothetical protein